MSDIAGKLATFSGPASAELADLAAEYNAGRSLEARFIKQLDKLEMLIQAFEYEQARRGFDLGSFFAWVVAKKKIEDAVLLGLLDELQSRRAALLAPITQ